MDFGAYYAKFRTSTPEDVRHILTKDLTCPIDWTAADTGNANPIFLHKWFLTVADALPNLPDMV